jgi:hypothetical protein
LHADRLAIHRQTGQRSLAQQVLTAHSPIEQLALPHSGGEQRAFPQFLRLARAHEAEGEGVSGGLADS